MRTWKPDLKIWLTHYTFVNFQGRKNEENQKDMKHDQRQIDKWGIYIARTSPDCSFLLIFLQVLILFVVKECIFLEGITWKHNVQ